MRADIHDGQGARNAPCNGPNTDARDQLSPDHYIRLAPHGRSIQKYMVKRCGPPSQGWRTFLRNHAPDIGAMDLFVVPTIGFDLLYAFVVVRLARRDLVWINVTANPTAESVASSHPRSGSDLWQRRHTPIARNGHPGQAYRTSLTLAERLCR